MQTWLGELIIRQQVLLLDARPFAQSQPKMRALGGGGRNGGLTDEDGHAPDFVTVYTHGCGNSWLGCHETVAVQGLVLQCIIQSQRLPSKGTAQIHFHNIGSASGQKSSTPLSGDSQALDGKPWHTMHTL